MQRKPGFPVANCSIKMPDTSRADPGHSSVLETAHNDDDTEHQQRRQQLINFGHSQWGFNNWNWRVTKQELDFVDFTNGKYFAGVVAFVSISVKNLDIHRENIGYATTIASTKGFAIYKSRKCAVTNALRETLLSFGGSVAAELTKALDTHHTDLPHVASPDPAPAPVPTPVVLPTSAPTPVVLPSAVPTAVSVPKPLEVKSSPLTRPPRKDSGDALRPPPPAAPASAPAPPPVMKNGGPKPLAPPVARAHPMPASLPRPPPAAPRVPPVSVPPASVPPPPRPNSNVSFVLQPVMPPLYAPPPRLAPPPHIPAPHLFPNAYYECSAGPWHFTYESYDRHHGNVNLNFNLPPKSLVVNREGREGEPLQYAAPQPGCWIKPTIFYDGFWTEQKVKKWVAEQVEKQFPDDDRKPASPAAATHHHDITKS